MFMLAITHKQCVLFASLISILATACNTSDSTKANDELKKDSMNTNTISPAAQELKGPAGHLYVDDGGRGDKLPILFVHSFGGNSQHWQNQLDYYRKSRRAVAFDLRGHGRSSSPENNNYSVEALARDIAAIADSLHLDRFILVGHSMGGSAAIAYAGKHPEKVAGLVIVGTPGKSPASLSKPIITSLESDKYDAVMSQYMDQLLKDAKPETDKLEREGMSHVSKEASISIIKSVFSYNPVPDLHRYPGPELIISRSGDEQPNSLHNEFPSIPYRTVEGTSHWIQLDKPAEFNRLLDEFLRRVEKR
jgi:pimeloyl-ACP methyl ester carboxylesterase